MNLNNIIQSRELSSEDLNQTQPQSVHRRRYLFHGFLSS